MIPALLTAMLMSGNSFTPVTYDLTSGSTSLTIPSGATGYEAWVIGGGGGGGWAGGGTNPSGYGGGGGAGGGAYRSGSVLAGEWGASLTRSVGAAGTNETSQSALNAAAGGNSTLSGTLGGVAISLAGNGGAATNTASGAAGGTASGGGTNTTGGAGTDIDDIDSDGFFDTPGYGGTPPFSLGVSNGTGGWGEHSTEPWSGIIRVKFT